MRRQRMEWHYRIKSISLCAWATVMIFIVLVTGLTVLSTATTASERAKRWAAKHSSSLPASLDTVLLFPEHFQKAIYASWSPDSKLALQREYLTRVISEDALLNEEQRAALRIFAEYLSASDFDSLVPKRDGLILLEHRNHDVLGEHGPRVLRRGAWRQAEAKSGATSYWHRLVAGRLTLTERILGAFVVAASDNECNCWVETCGKYDCPGHPIENPCYPNTPEESLCSRAEYDNCDWSESRPCNGVCNKEPIFD
jgi:hypothetical protein